MQVPVFPNHLFAITFSQSPSGLKRGPALEHLQQGCLALPESTIPAEANVLTSQGGHDVVVLQVAGY